MMQLVASVLFSLMVEHLIQPDCWQFAHFAAPNRTEHYKYRPPKWHLVTIHAPTDRNQLYEEMHIAPANEKIELITTLSIIIISNEFNLKGIFK